MERVSVARVGRQEERRVLVGARHLELRELAVDAGLLLEELGAAQE